MTRWSTHSWADRSVRARARGRCGVVDFLGQSVAAQQQLHAGRSSPVIVSTSGLSGSVTPSACVTTLRCGWLRACSAVIAPLVDQFLHVAVILRELAQLAVPQVGAAVADPGHLEAVAR
jgi:hypothetical protein